jgi:hypothetical protein
MLINYFGIEGSHANVFTDCNFLVLKYDILPNILRVSMLMVK